jgi:lantibiotic transport system ATP-binding protein
MQAAITTSGLTRRFGDTDAVRHVDLAVPAGSIYGFLGPNGAGKTTTIRMLTGLLRPTSGRITILGHAMPSERLAIARLLGALVETPSLYDHLTGRENLDITRRLLGLPAATIDRALDTADLRGAGGLRVGAYSLGMRQRLALARALLGSPRLLVLDEPGNGLDPDGISDLRAMLKRLAADAGMTVFVSSHQLAEIEQMATHVGVMARGELLAQGRLADVLGGGRSRVEIAADRPLEAEALLAAARHRVHREGDLVIADVAVGGDAVADIIARLTSAGLRLSEVRCCAPTLEDLYLDLTRSEDPRGSRPALAVQGAIAC